DLRFVGRSAGLLEKLAALDHGAAALAVALPLGLDAQLGKIRRRRGECRERDAALRREPVLERTAAVMLGVVLRVLVAHHQPAQALAKVFEAARASDAHDCGEQARLALVLEG